MTNNLTHWFTTGTERTISNERAIQSASKLEKLLNKNYDCLRQLSLSNVWELRRLNELFEQYNRVDKFASQRGHKPCFLLVRLQPDTGKAAQDREDW